MEPEKSAQLFDWLKDYHTLTLDACLDHFDPTVGKFKPYGKRVLDPREDENPLYRGVLMFANGDTLQEDLESMLFLGKEDILDKEYDVSSQAKFSRVLDNGSSEHNTGEWGEDFVFLLNTPAGTMKKVKKIKNSFQGDTRTTEGSVPLPYQAPKELSDKVLAPEELAVQDKDIQDEYDAAFMASMSTMMVPSVMGMGGFYGLNPFAFLKPRSKPVVDANSSRPTTPAIKPSYELLPIEFLDVFQNENHDPYARKDMRGYIGNKTDISLLVPQVLPSVKSYMIKRTPWPLGIGPVVQSGSVGVERIYHFQAESSPSVPEDADSPLTWKIYGIDSTFTNKGDKVVLKDLSTELLYTIHPVVTDGKTTYVIKQEYHARDYASVVDVPVDTQRPTPGYFSRPVAKPLVSQPQSPIPLVREAATHV